MIVNSNQIGYNSQVSGFSGLAIGEGAKIFRDKSLAIGAGATVSGYSGVCIGVGALDVEDNGNGTSVVIGTGASSYGGTAGANVLVGALSSTVGGNNVIMGLSANCSGNQSVVFGLGSTAVTNSVSMGFSTRADNNCIVVGMQAYSTGDFQCILGSKNAPAYNTYLGYGAGSQGRADGLTADGTNTLTGFGGYSGDPIAAGDYIVVSNDGGTTWTDVPIGTTVQSPSGPVLSANVPAGTVSIAWSPGYPTRLAATSSNVFTAAPDLGAPTLQLAGGQSIGQGFAGSVSLQTAFASTVSGTDPNAYSDRVYVNAIVKDLLVAGNGNPTDLFSVPLAGTSGSGGKIVYSVFATDGTDVQTTSGEAAWAGVADGASAVTSTAVDDATPASAVTTGTLAVATTTTSSTSIFTVSITPTSSLTPTVLNVTYVVVNNSPSGITWL